MNNSKPEWVKNAPRGGKEFSLLQGLRTFAQQQRGEEVGVYLFLLGHKSKNQT